MGNASFHLAQLNIARMRAPLEDPLMKGFVDRLDVINAIADQAPGFVWRLQDEAGDATSIRAFDDEMILVNMSVWESVEALQDYVYRSGHREPLRMRKDWFEAMEGPTLVLWWVPAGHVPTVQEARERLDRLAAEGPTPEAFSFRERFPAPQSSARPKPR